MSTSAKVNFSYLLITALVFASLVNNYFGPFELGDLLLTAVGHRTRRPLLKRPLIVAVASGLHRVEQRQVSTVNVKQTTYYIQLKL